ncbi:MAG TPA: 4-(cytidine 5'-diphospho)-2-C-methyl-D-erythritol kinase [Castellaniella sp.]|uniref:4-(cytidine 5'-diphospho)-2-C-methyl-D-erythritol kinase n=1 Tax=Castellaniella sp. TaxID=1955812 RepID=UPI002F23ECCC
MRALYDVPAPAKLNLFLHVTGRRPDGYHVLQTVFRFVDLCDVLQFERTDDGRVVRENAGLAGLAPEDDLVVRAALSLQHATGTRHGVRIQYEKHIPAGGGLGGGSSDAASALIALNRLWDTKLRRDELLRLALPLGADVPVFVFGQSAFAQGVGEDLTAVALPDRAYWILRPDVHISTAEVFRSPDLTRNSESVKIAVFTDWQTGHSDLFGRNDLEAVVFARYPQVARVASVLHDAGLEARMSGSGSCLFAEFDDLAQAQVRSTGLISKIHSLPGGALGGSWVCQGLSEHPLRGWVVV